MYVRRGKGWEARDVRIKYLTESRAIIEGLPEGTEVALVNPEQQRKQDRREDGTSGIGSWRGDAVTGQPGQQTTRFSEARQDSGCLT